MEDSNNSPSITPEISTQQTQVPVSPRKSLFKNKLFIIVMTLATLFTIFYAGVYIYLNNQVNKIASKNQSLNTANLSPTPDPTTNWKIYRSEDLGFEFKYPAIYSTDYENEQGVSLVKSSQKGKVIYFTISYNQQTFEPYEDFQDKICPYTEKNYPYRCIDPGKNWGQNENISETSLGGIKAKSFYIKRKDIKSATHIIQTTDSPHLEIETTLADSNEDKILKSIIASYKFIYDLPPSEVNNWKEYKLGLGGEQFSFKYPPEWSVFSTIPLEYRNRIFQNCREGGFIYLQNPRIKSTVVYAQINDGIGRGPCFKHDISEIAYKRRVTYTTLSSFPPLHIEVRKSKHTVNGKVQAWDGLLFQHTVLSPGVSFILVYKENTDPDIEKAFDQILSTFKFLDNKSNGVVCVQDAKLCPDGSYVTREGPNCEFSPCPGNQ